MSLILVAVSPDREHDADATPAISSARPLSSRPEPAPAPTRGLLLRPRHSLADRGSIGSHAAPVVQVEQHGRMGCSGHQHILEGAEDVRSDGAPLVVGHEPAVRALAPEDRAVASRRPHESALPRSSRPRRGLAPFQRAHGGVGVALRHPGRCCPVTGPGGLGAAGAAGRWRTARPAPSRPKRSAARRPPRWGRRPAPAEAVPRATPPRPWP